MRDDGRLVEAAARACLAHLEAAVAIDSQSDEDSETTPSTPGQLELARQVGAVLERAGARVELDDFGNVYGRIGPADRAPLALLVHLDTAWGTGAVPRLERTPPWDGSPVPYPARPELVVSVETYPETREFLGQRLVHGPGDAPVGLDDKLGLAECLALFERLAADRDAPPLLLVGRPDEEIGRTDALASVVERLRAAGVRRGYTVDGIRPFEVNVENFNAARMSVLFCWEGAPEAGEVHALRLTGVETHGATAKAEGYRSAVRLVAEIAERGVAVDGFASDPVREADGVALLRGPRAVLEAAVEAVVGPHRPRGAGWGPAEAPPRADRAAARAIRFCAALLSSRPGFVVRAADSAGRDGYSNPYRVVPTPEGLRVDVRVRDFAEEGLARRRAHLERLAAEHGGRTAWEPQYANMGPRLARWPELVEWAERAGEGLGAVRRLPIRGGTGVDPFLDAGIPLANLGTGYFAPESPKEFTALETMGRHVLWLERLARIAAAAG